MRGLTGGDRPLFVVVDDDFSLRAILEETKQWIKSLSVFLVEIGEVASRRLSMFQQSAYSSRKKLFQFKWRC